MDNERRYQTFDRSRLAEEQADARLKAAATIARARAVELRRRRWAFWLDVWLSIVAALAVGTFWYLAAKL